ncbi:hypothetical protein Trydic_g7402 [Trypoxylus dichotomus]
MTTLLVFIAWTIRITTACSWSLLIQRLKASLKAVLLGAIKYEGYHGHSADFEVAALILGYALAFYVVQTAVVGKPLHQTRVAIMRTLYQEKAMLLVEKEEVIILPAYVKLRLLKDFERWIVKIKSW